MSCKWCDKPIQRRQYEFCNKHHRELHRKFRVGFNMEMHYLKNKPKVSDTDKYKIIRRYLTNTY